MIFIDTGVWYSLLVPKDPNHQKTAKWFDSVGEQVVTCDYVVDETLTLLLMRDKRSKAIEFGNLVIVGSTAILHKLSEDQFHRGWLLFQRLSSSGLSFTDCTSHVVAVDLGIRTIASFDHHFQTTGRFQIVPLERLYSGQAHDERCFQDCGITPEMISAGVKIELGKLKKSPLLKVRMFGIECRCMAATNLP